MKTENTDLDYFNGTKSFYRDYYLQKEQRTLSGCLLGILIILTGTILFWFGFFKLLNWLF